MEKAKKENAQTLKCDSTHYAEEFYKNLGFKRIKDKKLPFYDKIVDVIYMEKSLII